VSKPKRGKSIRSSGWIKIDFLIPIVQDSTKLEHPHTAYQDWNTQLFLCEIDEPTHCGRDRGSEGWGKAHEVSDHWWVATPKRKLQVLLRLLRDQARQIFDQRWIIAWTGEQIYRLGDTVEVKRK
jgi:hypothetical protein